MKRAPNALPLPLGPRLRCKVVIDGELRERVGVVIRSYEGDVLALEAVDSPDQMPRFFFVKEGADWEQLTEWIANAWEVPRLGLPPGFAPLKKIPVEVTARFRALPVPERRRVLAELRVSGWLPRLRPLSSGLLPPSVSRSEVRDLCLLALGEGSQTTVFPRSAP